MSTFASVSMFMLHPFSRADAGAQVQTRLYIWRRATWTLQWLCLGFDQGPDSMDMRSQDSQEP